MKNRYLVTGLLLLILTFLNTGCFRGRPKEKPPVHLVPDMDVQPKYLTQGPGQFFEDGSAMRLPVTGTVARGHLNDDLLWYTGKNADGSFVKINPVPVTLAGLKRGQQSFNIYCSPCHSKIGDGQGILLKRGYVPPTSFHTDFMRQQPDGHFFDVITNGIRNMPSYDHQVPVEDRWLIIGYIRALQRSQNASASDIPEDMRDKIK